MKPRMTQKMRQAMKNYYRNRQQQRDNGTPWDKQADIENIFASCPKKGNPHVTYLEATAGTFLIWWSDKTQTIHNQKQYWRGTIFTKTIGDSLHVYTDLSGLKLPEKTVKEEHKTIS